LLLSTRNRESTMALGNILWQSDITKDTVPVLREVESLDHEHPISHNGRARIYNLLCRGLESTHPVEALKWNYQAFDELDKPQVKTEFYFDVLLHLARMEMKRNPDKAYQLVQKVLTTESHPDTLAPVSRSNITLSAIVDLRALGHVDEAKT